MNQHEGHSMECHAPADSDAFENSAIISRLRAEKDKELSALFVELRDQLKAMVDARLDHRLRGRVDSSDIVQEIFIRAARGLQSFLESPKVHPVVWLRLIGKQLVAETHRRNFRAKRSPDTEVSYGNDGDTLLVNTLADSLQSVRTSVERQETLVRVHAIIRDMPGLDREVLEMRHTEDLSLLQIAQTLEISLEAAKKRYQRAFKRFRELACELLSD